MYYIESLYRFFEEISRNNNREWFAANKHRYDDLRQQWMADLDRLISHMASWEPDLAGQNAKSAAYRFYRDTRFSPDKSPYKHYFAAAISAYGRKSQHAAYYLQMGLPTSYGDSGLYGGLWCPDSKTLNKVRRAIVDNIEEFESIIHSDPMKRLYPEWVGEALKTVPKGWDRNHPNADLLRLKDYGKYHHCDERFFLDPSWPERASELFRVLKPLNDFLNYSIDE